MEPSNERLADEAWTHLESEERPTTEAAPDPRGLLRHVQEEMERNPHPAETDLESTLAWYEAVYQVFTELDGDPEFEAWLNSQYEVLSRDPTHQDRVARDREQFLAMVKEERERQNLEPQE